MVYLSPRPPPRKGGGVDRLEATCSPLLWREAGGEVLIPWYIEPDTGI